MDHIAYEDGGVKVLIKLYDEDDPEIDRIAPDTSVELLSVDPETGSASLKLAGSDDRQGPLAYSIQIDGEGWSRWQLEDSFTIEGATKTEHLVEVIARDNWLNVDESPASLVVNLADPFGQTPESSRNCGCSSRTQQTGGFAGLLLVLASLVRRRR